MDWLWVDMTLGTGAGRSQIEEHWRLMVHVYRGPIRAYCRGGIAISIGGSNNHV
jgi:hypothetical protein